MTPQKEQWLRRRQTMLGASDMASILGVRASYMKTPVEIWKQKRAKELVDEPSLPMEFGAWNEQFVADQYVRQTGDKVERYTALLRHPDYPHVGGNVDRLVIPRNRGQAFNRGDLRIRTDTGLEAKVHSVYLRWQYGEEWSSDIPDHELIQVATYMGLTGCPRWHLASMFGNSEFAVFEIRQDAELAEIQQEIFRRAEEWWQRHIVGGVPPPPETEADVIALHPNSKAAKVLADSETATRLARLEWIKQARKLLDEAEERERLAVKTFLGAGDTLIVGGKVGATWKSRKPNSRFDLRGYLGAQVAPGAMADEIERLAEDIERTYRTVGGPARTFLLKSDVVQAVLRDEIPPLPDLPQDQPQESNSERQDATDANAGARPRLFPDPDQL